MDETSNDEKPYELVDLEAFLRELRTVITERPWFQQAAFLKDHAEVVAQSHAYVRGMIHGL